MKWLRFRAGSRERFGVLAGDMVQAYEGELLGTLGPVIKSDFDPAGGG